MLKPEIEKAFCDLGFKAFTEIQKIAISEILKGKNVLLIAPTGTGKTEAALLPVFEKFLESKPKGISILYITPLRALNRDLVERLERWSEMLGICIAVRHGDTTRYVRRKQALYPPHMLITTPETLQAILPGKIMRAHLRNIKFVIVDEIHEIAGDKRGAQLSIALERLEEVAGKFQRIGIGATIGSPKFVSKFLVKDEKVSILEVHSSRLAEFTVEKPMPKKTDKEIAKKVYSSIDASARLRRISELIKNHRSSLVFVNTREMAEILASRFRIIDEKIGIHHSSLSQEARILAEENFKKEELKALICTSSLELGIDIGTIDLVIQYNSPRQVTRLLQRVGRSGHRLGKRSKGIIIAADPDDILEALVIARRAKDEKLEEVEIQEKPYDVLAHQLVGLSLDFGRISKNKAYKIIKRSFVYRNLEKEEFEDVLNILKSLKLIWTEEEEFGKTKDSWKYYYENLSTIPDEKKYMVRNIVSQENIGMLDEAFVANNIEVGTVIIFKGAAWKVISLDEDISVEPALDVAGAIPSWIGEEIPVPMEVALEVAQIRGEPRMIEDYPANEYTKRLALSKVKRHLKKGIPVPDNTLILVELFENFVIIHSPFGTKVNQTIGRLFSVLLTSKIGSSVALQTDAYRVILHVPIKISEEEIRELFSTDSEAIEPILSKTLKRTSLFKWRFMHVARRFGILSKDVQYIDRMIRTYEESIVYREALKEVFRENLDIENTKKVFRDIKSGNLRVETISLPKPSPIGELGLKGYREVIVPERADKMIIQALKDRLSKKRLEVFCLYCADWSSSYRVGSIKDLKCGKCGARMLSVLKKNEKDLKRIYKKFRAGEKISEEEKKEVVKMQTCANLVLSYGKRAILAFAARGIGPEVAKRVLPAKDEQELYRNILKAERDFVRTKKFWQ